MTIGFSETLRRGKKKLWPAFAFTIGAYTIGIFKEVEVETEKIYGFHFVKLSHCRDDPKGMVPTHWKKVGYNWSYIHNKHFHEDKLRN